jgi:phosphoribosylaminoimidazolecarboxamide formyltransferase/IMP cyclohydrolase
MKAILSVYDKTGITDFARGLVAQGWELLSTGGTLSTLVAGGVPVQAISDFTGFPELLDGRVKTLHPKIHGGILGRRDLAEHVAQMAEHGIEAIDLVVVNLYPFYETVENIDIGGPAMLRAAAKNHAHVLPVCDPADYDRVLAALKDGVTPALRRELAAKAFQHTASYDTAVAQYLRPRDVLFPEEFTIALCKVRDLRYGENPHQKAALYQERIAGVPVAPNSLVGAEQLGGAELSYNNILDLEAAVACFCLRGGYRRQPDGDPTARRGDPPDVLRGDCRAQLRAGRLGDFAQEEEPADPQAGRRGPARPGNGLARIPAR